MCVGREKVRLLQWMERFNTQVTKRIWRTHISFLSCFPSIFSHRFEKFCSTFVPQLSSFLSMMNFSLPSDQVYFSSSEYCTHMVLYAIGSGKYVYYKSLFSFTISCISINLDRLSYLQTIFKNLRLNMVKWHFNRVQILSWGVYGSLDQRRILGN